MIIRLARNGDCGAIPAVERSGAELFAEHGMADVTVDPVVGGEVWAPFCASETLWVAEDEQGLLAGFIAAGAQEGYLFVYELSVRRDRQRQGLGRALLAEAERGAAALGLTRVLLTTFRDVPWNAPYYLRLGYAVVEEGDLPPTLAPVMASEHDRWSHRPDRARVAMAKPV